MNFSLLTRTFVLLIGSAEATTLNQYDSYALYEQPGRMIALPGGNRLSLYCTGTGAPTIILETGFGGDTYSAWHKLQPRIAKVSRICSYDRAGYGFSELGDDLPRDLKHDVTDLRDLLQASGEPGPYILIGHSDGGRIIEAFADAFPSKTAGMIFLDAAVLLEKEKNREPSTPSLELKNYFDHQLSSIRTCLERAKTATQHLPARPGGFCLDSDRLASLPPKMKRAAAEMAARPDKWRAFLSEAEQHYLIDDDSWAESLLPHHWQMIPIQVFTASVASLDDEHSAASYGLPVSDHKAIAQARAGRRVWEALQASICGYSQHRQSHQIPTAQHEVQNAVPDQISLSVQEMVLDVRKRAKGGSLPQHRSKLRSTLLCIE